MKTSTVSRRDFIYTATLGFAGLAFGGSAFGAAQGNYRIAPLPGRKYSAGFLKRCQKARFATPQEAVLSVRNEKVEYRIIAV